MRGVARLVARVRALPALIAPLEGDEEVLLVDELIARVVRHRVDSGVHADGVTRARLDAEPAEDAPQLVDDELHGVALVAATLVALGVLARFDVDALRGTRRRA